MKFSQNKLSLAIAATLSCSAAAQNTNNQTELEAINVYGQKQVTSLQDTHASIGLMTADQIETSTIQDMNDVFARTANITSLRGGNETTFAIRGVSIYGFTDNPANYTASVYVDEAPLNIDSIRYGSLGLWDVEQIEVYRGPQGTLQGRNSLMGAIHLKTVDPSFDEYTAKVQASSGAFGTQRLSAAGGGSTHENSDFAFRVSADNYKSDGYIENTTRNDDRYAGFDRSSYRAKLAYQPKGYSALSALMTISRTESEIGDQPMARSDDPFKFEALSDSPSSNDVTTDVANLKIDMALANNLTFTSVTTVTEDEYDRFDDFDSTSQPLGTLDQLNNSEGLSQELRLSFTGDKINGVTGIYFSESDNGSDWVMDTLYPKAAQQAAAYQAMSGFGITGSDADNLWAAIPDLIDLYVTNDSQYKTTNYAIFGEVNWATTDALTLSFGARYDKEDQKRDQNTVNNVNSVITDYDATTNLYANTLLQSLASASTEKADTDYEAVLPKFSAQYSINEDVSTAFTVQQGYRAGGSSVSLASATVKAFDPEFTTNYEVSLRSQFLDGIITTNANVFYTDWKDQQVDIALSSDSRDTVVGNAGESSLFGAELEANAFVNSEVEVFTSIGYVKTEFEEFTLLNSATNSLENFKGNEFPGAPNLTATLGTTFRSHQGIFASIDANFQDDTYVDNANSQDRKIESRTLVNAKVGYEALNWSGFLYVTNLADEEYFANNWEGDGIGVQDYKQPGAPRMIGASFVANF